MARRSTEGWAYARPQKNAVQIINVQLRCALMQKASRKKFMSMDPNDVTTYSSDVVFSEMAPASGS